MKLTSKILLASLGLLAIELSMSGAPGAETAATTQPAALNSATTQADLASIPATAPSAAVASDAHAIQAHISPEAKALLEQMRQAYASVKSLQIMGKVAGNYDIDGEKRQELADFSGLYDSHGLFRSEVKGDTQVGNTGSKVYVFLPSRNQYQQTDAPSGAVNLDTIGDDAADLLRKQNLSLALALSADAGREVSQGATSVTVAPDVQIDGAAFPALLIDEQSMDVTLAVDPQTHLVRRETADLTKSAKLAGARSVKSALLTIDFTNTLSAAGDAKLFAWTPPAGAQELKEQGDTSALVGKPAPAFALEDLNGKKVSSRDLKGSVYVLDFWATWCGPCVASLPKLDELYKSLKDSGLKVFALDQSEEKATVAKFIAEKKMTLTALLDSDSKVGQAYGVEGIPTTVVVGKDGRVRKVFVGSGNEDGIKQAVDAALKE
jgi:peroxiredoxin